VPGSRRWASPTSCCSARARATTCGAFSRYIVAWKLCTTMSAADVTDTLHLALQAADLDQADRAHRPRLLSDNGPSYVATDLSDWLNGQGMKHTRGKPYHSVLATVICPHETPSFGTRVLRCDSSGWTEDDRDEGIEVHGRAEGVHHPAG
jgi:hypothetical protein